MDFAIHLGDVVDGVQRQASGGDLQKAQERSDRALDQAIEVFGQFSGRTYHVVGNHCLYNFARPQLFKQYVRASLRVLPVRAKFMHSPQVHLRACVFGMFHPSKVAAYRSCRKRTAVIHYPEFSCRLRMDSEVDGLGCYAFSPHPKWQVIVLDAYDEAVIGWPRDSEKHRRAAAMLHTHNPTKVRSPSSPMHPNIRINHLARHSRKVQSRLPCFANHLRALTGVARTRSGATAGDRCTRV